MGIIDKSRQRLTKTGRLLKTDIRDLFKAEGRLVDQAFLDELFETLLKSDMGVAVAEEIIDEIGAAFRARIVQMDEIIEQINQWVFSTSSNKV
jgi:fused signal recognition particle receptor